MARLYIVTLNFAPEPSGFAPHATALARHLARQGHEVRVFTGFPFAPEWRRRAEDRGRWSATERDGRLTVRRLTHFIPRRPSSAWQRVLMEGSLGLVGFAAMMSAIARSGRPDLVLYIGAQPALAMTSRIVAALVRRPYIVRITDLAARAALDVGIVGPRLSRVLEAFERAAYRKAAGAMVLCSSFERDLVAERYPPERVRVIANPIDVEHVRPVPRDGRFRAEYGIPQDGFVVLHAGSMGLKQGLGHVIAAAALARDARLHWVFVGDGEARRAIVDDTRARGLDASVHFLPFQPEDRMAAMFAAADVLLVNQIRAVKDTLIPGKLLTYLAAGRPVLVAANDASQAAELIRAAGGGVLVAPEDPSALADGARALAAMAPETLAAMGARNRLHAEQHFDQRTILAAQEQFLLERLSAAPSR